MDDNLIELSIIKRSINGELTVEQQTVLDTWLSDPQNRDTYERIKQFDHDQVSEASLNLEKDAQELRLKIIAVKPKQKLRRRNLRIASYYAAAIMIPIAVVFTLLTKPNSDEYAPKEYTHTMLITEDGEVELNTQAEVDNGYSEGQMIDYKKTENTTVKMHKLITPVGETFAVTLSDGSKVWLSSKTELSYPNIFTGDTRNVTLKGEAYFEVEKSDTPFIVTVNDVKVKVYGTQFNINSYDGSVNTVLVSGKVGVSSISNPGNETILEPNQACYVNSNGEFLVSNVDSDIYTAWKQGALVFDSQSIEQIMETLTRWYDIEIVFSNESVRKLRFSGRISREESLNDVLSLIESTLLVSFELKDNIVTIK